MDQLRKYFIKKLRRRQHFQACSEARNTYCRWLCISVMINIEVDIRNSDAILSKTNVSDIVANI